MTDRIPGNLTRSNFKSQQLTIACKHWSQSLASRLLLGIPGDWLDHVLIRDCFVRNFPCCQCIMVQCTWFDKIHCRTHSFQTTNIFMYYLDPLHSHNVNQVLTAETMSPQSNMRCRAPKLACIQVIQHSSCALIFQIDQFRFQKMGKVLVREWQDSARLCDILSWAP